MQPQLWSGLHKPGIYSLAGDGEGGSWSYHYEPGLPCLVCLLRWWMARHHGPEWWPRLQKWSDFCLSWPDTGRLPRAPEPGWLHYRLPPKLHRSRLHPHPDCACGGRASGPRDWASWVHPVGGLVQSVQERCETGLWRVSLRLGAASSSGAALSRRSARKAALAELFERWAAHQPCSQEKIKVRRLGARGRRRCWSGLIYLGEVPRPHSQQLSHGLACGSSLSRALRAGFWELLERDALRRWWKAWRRGRTGGLGRVAQDVWVLPGPVFLAYQGQQGRGAWGSAAGPKGAERARREALHNFQVLSRQPPPRPCECSSFADHAAWGWHEPIPRWEEMSALAILPALPECPDWRQLAAAEKFYFARLECEWARQQGWTLVKVLSPSRRGLGIGGSPPFHPFS